MSAYTSLPDRFANPYLVCDDCRCRIYNHEHGRNWPCQHATSFFSVCRSWGPVDGCRCAEVLGNVEHDFPLWPIRL